MTFNFGPGFRFIEQYQEPTRIQIAGGEQAVFRLARELVDLPVVARFTIEGEPCSKSRARFTKRGSKTFAYTPEKTKQAEMEVARLFRETVLPDHKPDDKEITYGVMALFYCGNRQRRDVDNMLKLILDGLNKVAWPDDDQVIEISGRKALLSPDDARTEVIVYLVGKVQQYTMRCLRCMKEFASFRSWSSRRLYRSRECAYAHRAELNPGICAKCGKNFPRSSRPKSLYCSRDCAAVQVTVTCAACDKEFMRAKHHVRKNNYCSPECREVVAVPRRALAAQGVCELCGNPTTKKEYTRCMEHRRSKWDEAV